MIFSPWRRASERRAAVLSPSLTSKTAGGQSRPLDDFTALPQLGFFFRFSAWEMVSKI